MPVYLALSLRPDKGPLDVAVERVTKEADRFHLQADRGWLLRYPGTTVELSHALGFTTPERTSGPTGSGIVVAIGGYYGRGNPDMWEWLKTRMESA